MLLSARYLAVAVVLADGALKPVGMSGLWVGESRGSLYGLLIHSQRDRSRRRLGYGFDWNKMMLPAQAQEPTRDDVHEVQRPIVIDVEVRYLTDVA